MDEYYDIAGNTILITGSDTDLILKVADEFALEEADMVISNLNEEDFLEISDYIRDEYDIQINNVAMDLDDEKSTEEAIQKVEELLGQVDILVNTGLRGSNEVLMDRLSVRGIYPLFHINMITTDDDPFDMEDKIAVVTGASGRIGSQIVQKYSNEGAKLVLLSDNKEQLKEDVKSLKKAGIMVDYYVCDLDNPKHIRQCLEKIMDSHGSIDLLVNAAGMGQNKDVVDELIALDMTPAFCIVFLQKFANL